MSTSHEGVAFFGTHPAPAPLTDEQLANRNKRTCTECGWKGHTHEVLGAGNPFDEDDVIVGCPKCRCVNTIKMCCDEPGCWALNDCGTPTPDGYRSTCGPHSRGLITV